jgi:hypothetical protein
MSNQEPKTEKSEVKQELSDKDLAKATGGMQIVPDAGGSISDPPTSVVDDGGSNQAPDVPNPVYNG